MGGAILSQEPAEPKAEAYSKIYEVNTKESRCPQTMKRDNLSNLVVGIYIAMPKRRSSKALKRGINHKTPL
jgi:hypothetical protein